jgi:hypothetical protein
MPSGLVVILYGGIAWLQAATYRVRHAADDIQWLDELQEIMPRLRQWGQVASAVGLK